MLALACAFAGCSTHPRYRAHAPDWESDEFASAHAPSAPAPAAAEPPAKIRPSVEAPQGSDNRLPRATAIPAQEIWIPLTRWCKDNSLPAPTLQEAAPLATWLLTSPNGTLLLRAGTR